MTNQKKLIRKARAILKIFERNRLDLKPIQCPKCKAHRGEFHIKPCLGITQA